MAHILTINDLWRECIRARKEGKGNKQVLISCDDECNGYHSLFFGVQTDQAQIKDLLEYCPAHDNNDPNDVVLLG